MNCPVCGGSLGAYPEEARICGKACDLARMRHCIRCGHVVALDDVDAVSGAGPAGPVVGEAEASTTEAPLEPAAPVSKKSSTGNKSKKGSKKAFRAKKGSK